METSGLIAIETAWGLTSLNFKIIKCSFLMSKAVCWPKCKFVSSFSKSYGIRFKNIEKKN